MRKVLLADDLKNLYLAKNSFQNRADIQVFTAASNDDILSCHRKEKIDLIITRLDLPGITSEELFSTIRHNGELRDVSIIIICRDTLAHRERSKQCNANAVFTIPVDPTLLHYNIQQFLKIAPRKSYRTSLAVAIEGRFKNKPQPFWTENISMNGMLIRTKEPLIKGAGIFFSFFLPNGTHISGYGEITRIVPMTTESDMFLYGIKFTNIEPSATAALALVVKQ